MLSFTGNDGNDVADVSKTWSSKIGAYVIEVRSYNSANCTDIGTHYDCWLVTCPAQNVKRLTFDGGKARQLPQHDQPPVGRARRPRH